MLLIDCACKFRSLNYIRKIFLITRYANTDEMNLLIIIINKSYGYSCVKTNLYVHGLKYYLGKLVSLRDAYSNVRIIRTGDSKHWSVKLAVPSVIISARLLLTIGIDFLTPSKRNPIVRRLVSRVWRFLVRTVISRLSGSSIRLCSLPWLTRVATSHSQTNIYPGSTLT